MRHANGQQALAFSLQFGGSTWIDRDRTAGPGSRQQATCEWGNEFAELPGYPHREVGLTMRPGEGADEPVSIIFKSRVGKIPPPLTGRSQEMGLHHQAIAHLGVLPTEDEARHGPEPRTCRPCRQPPGRCAIAGTRGRSTVPPP